MNPAQNVLGRLKRTLPTTLLLLIALPLAASAQNPPGPPSHHYSHYDIDIDLHADGTYVETTHITTRILDAQDVAASRKYFVPPLPMWLSGRKTRLDILTAVTIKPDGRRVDAVQLDSGDKPTGANTAFVPPLFHVSEFQDVQVGDTLEFTSRFELLEADADPGMMLDRGFWRTDFLEDVRVSVRAPRGKLSRFETLGAGRLEKGGDEKTEEWKWVFENRQPVPVASGAPMDPKNYLGIHVSSYADRKIEMQAMMARTPRPAMGNLVPSVPRSGVDASIPGDLVRQSGMPRGYAMPRSTWKEAEKAAYEELLAQGTFDVLVVPFQVQSYALDRTTRSLMTAELAQVQSESGGARVPDPYLVARALGDGERHFDPQDVYRFAARLGVHRIVWGFVGHDRQGKLLVALQRQSRDAAGELGPGTAMDATFTESAAFTDEKPPLAVFEELLPRIAAGVLGAPAWHPAAQRPGRLEEGPLPDSPLAFLARATDPARAALAFQVLAYLTPASAERARERFAEKSWLALRELAPASADYRVLVARAWWLLGQRPAALQALGDPQSAEERELRALLDGNQPEAQRLASQVRSGAFRLFATIDSEGMLDHYLLASHERSEEAITPLQLPGATWPHLAGRAIDDADLWAQFDNTDLKLLLDRDFPIPDFTLPGLVKGAISAGNLDEVQTRVDLSVLRHVRLLMREQARNWCCQGVARGPVAHDYLDLIEAVGEINPLRVARYLTHIQGRPKEALEHLSRLENTYKGHPGYELVLGEAQLARAKSLSRPEAATLRRTAFEHLREAFYASGTPTRVAAGAIHAILGLQDVTSAQDYVMENFYSGDIPLRPSYPLWEFGGPPPAMQSYAEAALRNSSSDLGPFRYLVQSYGSGDPAGEGKVAQLFRSVEGRFAGSTTPYQLKYDFAIRKGDEAAAEAILLKSIEIQPRAWRAYDQLADLYVSQGHWDQGAEVYMKYPGFRGDPGFNPVSIANEGNDAGNRFYRVGAPSLAARFFEISSRRSTGAAADNRSAARLALLDGRFEAASEVLLDCARHYNNAWCYENYLNVRFSLGAGAQAWDEFHALVQQFDRTSLWNAAMTGHRIEGLTERDLVGWAKQQFARGAGKAENRLAILLLMEGVTDRIPGPGFAAELSGIALPAYRKPQFGGGVVQPQFAGGPEIIVGPRRPGVVLGKATLPSSVGKAPAAGENVPVKSGLVYLAEIERALHGRQTELAASLAKEAAAIYDLGDARPPGNALLLPYYAFAVARSGHPETVDAYLSDFGVPERGFHYHLARATVLALQGKTAEALGQLREARNRRDWASIEMLDSAYIYAEICTMLADATKRAEFRDEALDWARATGKLRPTFSWAYSLTAIMTTDPAERARAIALASFLDPNSDWLSRIPASERAAAVKAFQGRNPFQKNPDARRPGMT